jgi:outer membrane receptor protein involved in Fe transport
MQHMGICLRLLGRPSGIAVAAAISTLLAAPAYAQDQEQQQEAEAPYDGAILVTATRREQSLSDTSLAISAISGESLARANVTSLQDLVRVDPSLAIQNYGAAFNQFIIRGIESESSATTGLYFDEVPLLGGMPTEGGGDGSPSLRLIDLERVEVLKGPQGTLFGSGSMAGTIRLITREPEMGEFGGSATLGGGIIDSGQEIFQGNVAVNVPLGETFAVRAVGWGERGGGYIDQTYAGQLFEDVNDAWVRGGRLVAKWQATPDFTLSAGITHQQIDVDGTQNYDLALGDYLSSAQSKEPYSDNFDLVTLTGEYDTGVGTITLAGSYSTFDFFRPKDTTPTNQFFGLPGTARYAMDQGFRAYTGELRFASDFDGPVQVVAGAYYEDDRTDYQDAAIQTDPISGEAPCNFYYDCIDAGASGALEYATALNRSVEQFAFYGQVDWEIVPSLTATVGARYFNADIHNRALALQDISDWFGGVVTTPYETQDDKASENNTSYNFALRYELAPDVSVYARVASGFRIGGTNNAQNAANNFGIIIPATYGSDSLWDYEVGFKGSLIDRLLYVDWSVYRIDWTGQQLPGTDPSGAFTYIINAGKTRIYGSEFQLTAHPTDGLMAAIGVTYTDAQLTEDLPEEVLDAGVIGFDGDRVPRIPKWSVNAQAEYETPISSTLSGFFGGNLTYRGSSFYAFESDPAGLKLDEYVLIGLQAGVRADSWNATLYVENLTNKEAQVGIYSSLDGVKVYSPRPRTFGLRLSTEF